MGFFDNLFGTITQKIAEKATERYQNSINPDVIADTHGSAQRQRNNRNDDPLDVRVRELYARNGYYWDESVNIFGFRDETDQKKDVWNDLICVIVDTKIHVFKGTTDPGVYWARKSHRKKAGMTPGAAHLCLGQYVNTYVVGNHRGHEALVQWGGKVKVWRDINSNLINDENVLQEGYFGINIHRGAGKTIGKWSAGCQVIQGYGNQAQFMRVVKSSLKFAESGKKARFNYTLFEKGQERGLFKELSAIKA